MKFYEDLLGDNNKQSNKNKVPDNAKVQQKGKPQNINKNKMPFNQRQSVFLNDKQKQDQQKTFFQKYCNCLSLQYYKDYYKVTNNDVQKRILSNLKFWQGKFFDPVQQNYDFYGPFWIHTTVVFCLGAVHNLLQYQGNKNYDYDFEILGQAFFLMYALGFGLPIGIGFIMKSLLDIKISIIQILCLYGYSSSIYILCILLCSFNICLLHWIFLAYGVATKFYFIFKNINEGFEVPAGKKIILMVMIAVQAALQVLIFKVRFIYCVDSNATPAVAQKHFLQNKQMEVFHFRTYHHDVAKQFLY